MPDRYDIYTRHGASVARSVALQEAARLLDVAGEEIEWAIDECGRCDAPDATALPEGEGWTPLNLGALAGNGRD